MSTAPPNRRRVGRWLLGGLALPALAGSYGAWAGWRRQQAADALPLPDEVCRVAPLQVWTPALGPDRLAPRQLPPDARCPVCGMYPARQPRWACQLIYRDGAAHFFDAALDLLLYLQHPGRHAPGYGQRDIARLYVADANGNELRWLAAEASVLLVDTRWPPAATAPMRRGALPAFGDREQALQIRDRYGGALISWSQMQGLRPEQWPESLRGLGPHH